MTSKPQRFWWLNPALLTLIVVLLLVSIGLQGGVINPNVEANRDETRTQGLRLAKVTCGVAQQTANAFTQRQVGPNDQLETLTHYLIRLQAQRYTLLAAIGADCPNAKGFPPFKVQLRRRLTLLERILGGHGVVLPRPGENSEPAPKSGGALQPGSTGSQPPSPSNGGQQGTSTGGKGTAATPAPSHPGGQPTSTPPATPSPEGAHAPADEATPPTATPSAPAEPSPVDEPEPTPGSGPIRSTLETVGTVVCSATDPLVHLC